MEANMSGIQVAQGQERFVKSIGDYTENQSTNKVEYVTGQNVGGKKRAMDTVVYGTYLVSTGNLIAVGSTTRIIKKVAHGARENDIIQFTSGNNAGIAIQILSCPDADTMIIAATPEFTSAVGDTFDIKRYVSPQYAADGSLAVTATTGPLQVNVDGVATEVNVDTITPANTVRVPVEIYSASGLINITAGDINVQLTDTGANPDVTKIGDGTNRLGINASTEALVHDTDVLAQAELLVAKDFATQTTLSALLTELQLKADLLETQPVSLASSPLPTDAATQTTLAALLTELQLKADLLETQPVSIAGTVAVSGGLTDTELRATALPVSGPLTDTQLRATPVPVSGTITATQAYIAGTLKSAQITVGTTEVRATTDASAPSATRNKLMIKPSNANTGKIFLIPTGGGTSTGMQIVGPDRLEFLYDPTDYYLISDTAAQTVEIVEVE
jgi:hypothetical protein